MRNTIRKVMTVVTVFATSCQVSDQWKTGPVISQRRIDADARMNATVDPDHLVAQLANRSNMCPPLAVGSWQLAVGNWQLAEAFGFTANRQLPTANSFHRRQRCRPAARRRRVVVAVRHLCD